MVDPLGFLERLNRNNSQIALLRIGNRRDVVVLDPDLIETVLKAKEEELIFSFNSRIKQVMGNGLLSTQGSEHRHQRQRLKPLFFRREFAEYVPRMAQNVEATLRGWQKGEELDIASAMLGLSFNIIIDVLMDRSPSETRELRSSVERVLSASGRMGFFRRMFSNKIRKTGDLDVFQIREGVDRTICPWVGRARDTAIGSKRSIMASLRQLHDALIVDRSGSDLQTRDELVTFLIAGHETTAMALSWTFYLLSQHPDVDEKLHREIVSVLHEREILIDDVPKLRYTTAVLKEAMRLYPPIWLMMRRTREDWQLGEHLILKNSYIHISPWAVHHNELHFPDAYRFDPRRFIGKSENMRHRYSYIPFGDGTRRCLGETMALTQATLVLASICRKWKLQLRPRHRVVPQPLTSLRPKHGLPMKLIARS
jgi:cytochrome P450